ncbi:MAG: Rrf2 family transcriptional regulator [Candidatus Omnitrophica bacterium]|nr:Rrf2 family transcriptional regulator [Candidatus Omnitrophota bacterium]
MKLLTRDTDYAVRALLFIARQNRKIVSVRELVRELRIPKPFLRKILQILNQKKLLHSFKGQGGGFRLARPAERILLTDLISIFQGKVRFNECMFKKSICPEIKICALKKRLDEIERYVVKKLSSITIGLLLKEERASYGKKKDYKNR